MKGMESNNKPPNKNMSINDMSDEIWVLLSNYKKGLNDKFMVSNLGRVKDVDRFVRNGKTGKRFIKSKIMPQANDGRGTIGYMRVSLSDNKRSVSILVHKLVAHCFIGDIPNGYHINHKDFNTHNNNVLEFLNNPLLQKSSQYSNTFLPLGLSMFMPTIPVAVSGIRSATSLVMPTSYNKLSGQVSAQLYPERNANTPFSLMMSNIGIHGRIFQKLQSSQHTILYPRLNASLNA